MYLSKVLLCTYVVLTMVDRPTAGYIYKFTIVEIFWSQLVEVSDQPPGSFKKITIVNKVQSRGCQPSCGTTQLVPRH
jgi:hypothetical protein